MERNSLRQRQHIRNCVVNGIFYGDLRYLFQLDTVQDYSIISSWKLSDSYFNFSDGALEYLRPSSVSFAEALVSSLEEAAIQSGPLFVGPFNCFRLFFIFSSANRLGLGGGQRTRRPIKHIHVNGIFGSRCLSRFSLTLSPSPFRCGLHPAPRPHFRPPIPLSNGTLLALVPIPHSPSRPFFGFHRDKLPYKCMYALAPYPASIWSRWILETGKFR